VQFLKPVRVVLSVIIVSAFMLLFLDVYHLLPQSIVTIIAGTQLAPSILKMIEGRKIIFFGIFILLVTLFFGRLYCSTLCPFGILQDFFSHIPIWRNKRNKRRFRYSHPSFKIHYVIFAAIVLLPIFGSFIVLNLLEPYSVFGRMVVTLGVPVVIGINNLGAAILGDSGILSQLTYRHFQIWIFVYALLFLVFIAVLAYKKGRLFCNLLCPVGAFLGILSRFSMYKISIVPSACKECGVCEKVCKARCIDSANMKIDFAACVSCFNCIDVCPTSGIKYRRSGKVEQQNSDSIKGKSRRVFLKSAIILPAIAKISTIAHGEQTTKSRYYNAHAIPITPPGSESVNHFSSHCTACYLCVEKCPSQVITPATVQYGLSGIFQPHMDYSISYCDYDCTACSQVCPTSAIKPITVDQKHEIQIGVAEFIEDDCIVKVNGTDCGACSEHCPTKAVTMVPYGELFIPEVHQEYCVGCGACEHSCPALPRKAIYVIGRSEHKIAKKPVTNDVQEEQPLNEFPF